MLRLRMDLVLKLTNYFITRKIEFVTSNDLLGQHNPDLIFMLTEIVCFI